eukprot:Colp12_sorted_trinity150504_noHs@13491
MSHFLYIGNLPPRVKKEDVVELLEPIGKPVRLRIVRPTSRNNFCFVAMETAGEIEKAVDTLNTNKFKGRSLKVQAYQPKDQEDLDPTVERRKTKVAKEVSEEDRADAESAKTVVKSESVEGATKAASVTSAEGKPKRKRKPQKESAKTAPVQEPTNQAIVSAQHPPGAGLKRDNTFVKITALGHSHTVARALHSIYALAPQNVLFKRATTEARKLALTEVANVYCNDTVY